MQRQAWSDSSAQQVPAIKAPAVRVSTKMQTQLLPQLEGFLFRPSKHQKQLNVGHKAVREQTQVPASSHLLSQQPLRGRPRDPQQYPSPVTVKIGLLLHP